MRFGKLILFFLFVLCGVGCPTLPDAPPVYDEEVVLAVWDLLDDYYGSETFFECELLPVHDGEIRIIKPYGISRIAVVGYSRSEAVPIVFRAVQSNPGENEFLVRGTMLLFHPSHENQRLFVAWVPRVSEIELCVEPQECESHR